MAVEPWDRSRDIEAGQPQGRQDHAWTKKDLELRGILTKPGDMAVFYFADRWYIGTVAHVKHGNAQLFEAGPAGQEIAVWREDCGTVYVCPQSWLSKPIPEIIEAAWAEDSFGGIMRHVRQHRVLRD